VINSRLWDELPNSGPRTEMVICQLFRDNLTLWTSLPVDLANLQRLIIIRRYIHTVQSLVWRVYHTDIHLVLVSSLVPLIIDYAVEPFVPLNLTEYTTGSSMISLPDHSLFLSLYPPYHIIVP
jgi:hypothetical protein